MTRPGSEVVSRYEVIEVNTTRHCAIAALLAATLAGGCSSGGGTPFVPLTSAEAQEFMEDCGLASELQKFAETLDFLQNLFAGGTEPVVDFTVNPLTFQVNWTADLDANGTDDLVGTLQVRDQFGRPALPIDPNNPPNIDPNDTAAVLALLDGFSIHVTFQLVDLPMLTGNTGTGNGTLEFGVSDGKITDVSGRGTFISGACTFDATFDTVTEFDPLVDGFPISGVDFTLFDGGRLLVGSIDLNGTEFADLSATVEDGVDQYVVDIANGLLIPVV